jgi:parallel beta-helix repeat protein
MKRKWLAVGIILLLVELVLIPSTTSGSANSKNIITVDDEPGDADYTLIGEALSHSGPLDIIQVYSGQYREHGLSVTVEGLSFIGVARELGNGSDTGRPFIDGQGLADVFDVYAPNVTITGFSMTNNGPGAFGVIVAYPGADGCLIADNDLRDSVMAVIGCVADNSKIINNTVSNVRDFRQGIGIGGGNYPGADHTLVADNDVSGVRYGISVWGGVNETITRNYVHDCYDIGLDLGGGGLNITITYNTVENNPTGIYLMGAQNRVIRNNFINNTQEAYFGQVAHYPMNRWLFNYWDHSRLLPYPVFGCYGWVFIPWIQWDWRPALRPYDILGMK